MERGHCKFDPKDLPGNAAKLVAYFGLSHESEVPVGRFAISTDGAVRETNVGEGKYKSALLLHYLAHAMHGYDPGVPRVPFPVTQEMRTVIRDYFGDEICSGAEHNADTKHTTVRSLLVGKHIAVVIVMKPVNAAVAAS
ncbi:MAG TPA: hypothetical protein VF803_01515 [Candidatus Paceibacterota bacterium]